ncbi:MAG: HU family DNA-binding protein [Bacteroidaceae bacterium]|nr:HU family DNA-binding protein [Bacteroidaceae bacterium]
MGKITLVNIAEDLVAKSGLAKEDADKFLHAFVETIEKGLRKDKIVKVRGLGTFKLMDMNGRDSVDVNTGERITIKGYTKVSFTPDSSMKEFVNRPFAHFEPVELNDGYPDEEEPVEADESVDESVDEDTPQPVEEQAEPIVEEVQVVAEVAEVATVEESAPESTEVAETVEAVEVADTTEETETVETIEASEPVETSEVAESHESVEPVEPVEEVVEEPSIVADAVSSGLDAETEEQQELPSEEVAVEAIVADEAVEKVATSPASEEINKTGKKHSRRRGVGGIIVLLLIVAVAGVYYLTDFTIGDIISLEKGSQEIAEREDIKVNPHLVQELGGDRGHEPKVEEAAPEAKAEAVAEAKQEEVSAPVEVAEVTPSVEAKPTEVVAETKPVAASETNTVVIAEALAAKSIKEITIADTTDYVMGGTLATHKLQAGETIIQLARKYYGDKRLWPYIVKYNQITDFNKVSVGMSVDIPALSLNTNN